MNDNLYSLVSNKVSEIKDSILCNLHLSEQCSTTHGIMGNDFGILLFLFHYAKTMKDEETVVAAQELAEHIMEILSYTTSASYCEGWAGILMCFDYLRDNDFIDIETDDIITAVEANIEDYTRFCLSNGIFEFLYGASGVGFYWLQRNNKRMIDNIVSALYKVKESDSLSGGYKWKMQSTKMDDRPDYNLSMSHGLVGMLLFLLRVFERYGDDMAKEMLVSGVYYLLSHRNTEKASLSVFPSTADSDKAKQSRLGWCYGDLGCAYLLYEASTVCQRDDWKQIAIDIYRHASFRRTYETSMVSDAGLCHGSSGVAMMFRNIANNTIETEFKECADYWIKETLAHSRFTDGLAGYKSLYINSWYNDLSFLTGIPGIGLSLLSHIDSECKAADYFLLK